MHFKSATAPDVAEVPLGNGVNVATGVRFFAADAEHVADGRDGKPAPSTAE